MKLPEVNVKFILDVRIRIGVSTCIGSGTGRVVGVGSPVCLGSQFDSVDVSLTGTRG